MAQSIKKRIGGSKLGEMTAKELKKLLDAALTDLTALRSQVNNIAADAANVQIIVNNHSSGLNNVRATVCNVIADVRNVRTTTNQVVLDVNNIKTNCSNATVNSTVIAAIAVGNTTMTTNINDVTLAAVSAMAALTLTS